VTADEAGRPPAAKIVLVVEEQVDVRDALVAGLRGLGYIAIPVADADSATVVIRKLRPSLIVWNVRDRARPIAAILADWKRRRPDAGVIVAGVVPTGPTSAGLVLPTPVAPEQLEAALDRLPGVLRPTIVSR
jgi:DNA-binding NtrC family response regulator